MRTATRMAALIAGTTMLMAASVGPAWSGQLITYEGEQQPANAPMQRSGVSPARVTASSMPEGVGFAKFRVNAEGELDVTRFVQP